LRSGSKREWRQTFKWECTSAGFGSRFPWTVVQARRWTSAGRRPEARASAARRASWEKVHTTPPKSNRTVRFRYFGGEAILLTTVAEHCASSIECDEPHWSHGQQEGSQCVTGRVRSAVRSRPVDFIAPAFQSPPSVASRDGPGEKYQAEQNCARWSASAQRRDAEMAARATVNVFKTAVAACAIVR
jgi:hypothetical protein